MPASPQSLAITDTYRRRLGILRRRVLVASLRGWESVTIDQLPETHAAWSRQAAVIVEQGQRSGMYLTSAYVAAFLTSETGAPPVISTPADAAYVGVAEDGRPLTEALESSLIAVRAGLKDNMPADDALRAGLRRSKSLLDSAIAAAPRFAFRDIIANDDRIAGWRRVTSPHACGACLAAADGRVRDKTAVPDVHDGCGCGAEPVVGGVTEHVVRPTGRDIFNAMTPEAQDERLGPDKAELLRSGAIDMPDLIATSPMATVQDRITETPLRALA